MYIEKDTGKIKVDKKDLPKLNNSLYNTKLRGYPSNKKFKVQ